MFTHEQYIQAVAGIVTARLNEEDKAKLACIKLAYGAGQAGLRGVTYYDRWGKADAKAPFVEVCAFGQEGRLQQLAGTTIHELAHVIAGWNAGHGKEWLAACKRLGLRRCHAAGTNYQWASFDPDVRLAIAALPAPDDGSPVAPLFAGIPGPAKPKPCAAGIGTRGGKSRGAGSGSRLRKFVCECTPPIIVRAARDTLPATCDCCTAGFKLG